MIDSNEFSIYKYYLRLQKEYKQAYQELELQYQLCKCASCKMEMIVFGLELLSLSQYIQHFENQITPKIGTILKCLEIDHIVTEQTTELMN